MTIGWNFLVLNWQLLYKNLLDGQFPWVIYNRQSYCSYNQFNNGCRSGYIFTARDKILARDENQREKRQQQQKQRKTNKNKHLKKIHNPWQHKDGTNTLVKLIRLMEVNGRHNFIRTGASDLVFWKSRVTKMLSLNKKRYHWKKEMIEIGNLHMFWTSKNYAFSTSLCYTYTVFVTVKNLTQYA